MSVAGTIAVTCVALTKAVISGALFADTIAPDRKPVPLTVNVKAALPAVTVAGEMLVMTGAGGAIAKVTVLENGPKKTGKPPVSATSPPLAKVIGTDPG